MIKKPKICCKVTQQLALRRDKILFKIIGCKDITVERLLKPVSLKKRHTHTRRMTAALKMHRQEIRFLSKKMNEKAKQ